MASVYSGAGEGRYGSVTVKGQVEFGMQYNYKQGTLEIYVAQCRDLAAVDAKRNRSDPYVKVGSRSMSPPQKWDSLVRSYLHRNYWFCNFLIDDVWLYASHQEVFGAKLS